MPVGVRVSCGVPVPLTEAHDETLGEPDAELQPVTEAEPVGVGVPDAEAVEERERAPENVNVVDGVKDALPEAELESHGDADAEGEWAGLPDTDEVRVSAAVRVPFKLPVCSGDHEVEGEPEEVASAEVVRAALRVTLTEGVSRTVAEWLRESNRLEGDTDAEPEGVAVAVEFAVAESAAVAEAEGVTVAETVGVEVREVPALVDAVEDSVKVPLMDADPVPDTVFVDVAVVDAEAVWEEQALTEGVPAFVKEPLTVAVEVLEAVEELELAIEADAEKVSAVVPVALGVAEVDAEPDALGDDRREAVSTMVAVTVNVAEGVAAALTVPPLRLGVVDADPEIVAAAVAERLSDSEKEAVAEPLRVAPEEAVCELDADTVKVAVTVVEGVVKAVFVAVCVPVMVLTPDTDTVDVGDLDVPGEREMDADADVERLARAVSDAEAVKEEDFEEEEEPDAEGDAVAVFDAVWHCELDSVLVADTDAEAVEVPLTFELVGVTVALTVADHDLDVVAVIVAESVAEAECERAPVTVGALERVTEGLGDTEGVAECEFDTLAEPVEMDDTVPEKESFELRVSLGEAETESVGVAVAVGEPLPEAVSEGRVVDEGSALTLPEPVDAAVMVTVTVVD